MPANYSDISSLIISGGQPVSFGHPEKAPSSPRPEMNQEQVEIHEVVEHKPDSEVAPYVEPRPDKIDLPQDLKDVGVESTGHTQFPSYNSVKLPISDEKVLQGLHNPLSSSVRWLAEVCMYILRKAHVRLREAHGKAVRMFDTK